MAKEVGKQTRNNREVVRYRLEQYSGTKKTRHACPNCGDRQSFARFIDITTAEYAGDDIGRCNRETECGYQKSPSSEYLDGKPIYVNSSLVKKEFQYIEKDYINTIDLKYLIKSQINIEETIFVKFLLANFDKLKVMQALNRYKVGRGQVWVDSNVFWQIDANYDIRTGKIMLYEGNGKRKKDPYNYIQWTHTPSKVSTYGETNDYVLEQCFFGEHLLNEFDSNIEVRIVESEKTAIICSIINPNQMWVATGGLSLISEKRLNPFKNRKMIFYPDKGKALELWKKKLEPFKDFDITINEVLEKQESIGEGQDLADFILEKELK